MNFLHEYLSREAPAAFAFYGTLMDSQRRAMPRTLGEYGRRCVLRGDLYSVHGSFPALVEGDGEVAAQLFYPHPDRLAEALGVFDRIEGFRPYEEAGSLYLRRTVETLDEPRERVWAYLWNGSVDRLEPIPGGCWREWVRGLRGVLVRAPTTRTVMRSSSNAVTSSCCWSPASRPSGGSTGSRRWT